MPTMAGSIRAPRLSTFETTTERTPRRDELGERARRRGSPQAGRRGPARTATPSRRRRGRALPSGRRRGAAGWQNRSGCPSPRSTTCARTAVVGREARHQRHGDLGAERVGQAPRLPELDLEEAAAVDRLRHGLDAAAEPRCHATGEDDHRDRARAERLRPRCDGLVEARARRAPAMTVRSEGSGGSTAPSTTFAAGRRASRRRAPARSRSNVVGVEPVALEDRARPRIDLVQDHRDRTGAGSEAAYGAR